jgi:hypothetical protein
MLDAFRASIPMDSGSVLQIFMWIVSDVQLARPTSNPRQPWQKLTIIRILIRPRNTLFSPKILLVSIFRQPADECAFDRSFTLR